MCLAIAGTIRSVDGAKASVDYGGLAHSADLTLVPEAKIGDRVLVHAGFAIAVLDEETGDEMIRLDEELRRYG